MSSKKNIKIYNNCREKTFIKNLMQNQKKLSQIYTLFVKNTHDKRKKLYNNIKIN